MHQYLDTDDLYAYLSMLRSSDSRLFLIVEGTSDVSAISRQVNDIDCSLICGYSKPVVVDTMVRLQHSDPDGCVALIDRDFDDWLGMELPPSVFTTELYDREADLLLRCGLLTDYLAVVKDDEKERILCLQVGGSSLLGIFVCVAAVIGRVRWITMHNRLGLKLSRFPIGEILNSETDSVCWVDRLDGVVEMALKRSPGVTRTKAEIVLMCGETLVQDEERLCSGHDLVSAVAVSSILWARYRLSRRELMNHISATVRCDVLEQLRWYRDLDAWAEDRGYEIWNCGQRG